jgi:preprotein translocase subunit Sec63
VYNNIPRISTAKAIFNKKEDSFINKLDLNVWKKLVKCYIRSTALYSVVTSALQKTDQKYYKSFEMWRWRGLEKVRSIVRKMKNYCTKSRRTGTSYIQDEARLIR